MTEWKIWYHTFGFVNKFLGLLVPAKGSDAYNDCSKTVPELPSEKTVLFCFVFLNHHDICEAETLKSLSIFYHKRERVILATSSISFLTCKILFRSLIFALTPVLTW